MLRLLDAATSLFPREATMSTPWQHRFAQRTQRMTSSAIRELLKLTERPDIISFAGGLPAPEAFPVDEIRAAADNVLREHGTTALQYGTTEGSVRLREAIARQMARYGIVVPVDSIIVTAGSQQALDLIAKVLLNPGDRILTETPSYLGAIQAFTMYGAEYVTVPMDDDGMRIDTLETALRVGPKFMYLLPNFQNPSGVTLSLERRRSLIALSDRYGIPLVEDDPYGQLRYEGEHIRPLVVLDAEKDNTHADGKYSGNVIYMSTLSKTLAPGIRLGWIVAPREVIHRLVQAKQGTDLHTSTFVQLVAAEALERGVVDRNVRRVREMYRGRRDVMLRALERAFPDPSLGVTWTRPQGGLFLWMRLPAGMSAVELLPEAIEQSVAFVPGVPFHPDGTGANTLRLNFSHADAARIEEGIARLGRVVMRHVERAGRASPVA
jgi:2-aminoadipate transaminase